MQQLGTFWVRRFLEDGARLGPTDEIGFGGEGDAEGAECVEADARAEGGDVLAVGGGDEADCGCGAANPAGVLEEEGVEPFPAVLLDTVFGISKVYVVKRSGTVCT